MTHEQKTTPRSEPSSPPESSEVRFAVDEDASAFEEIMTPNREPASEMSDSPDIPKLSTFNPIEHLERRRPSFMPPIDTIAGRLASPPERGQRLFELETAVAQQERQIEGLLNIAGSLRRSTKPEEAMKSIVVQISQLLGADRTTIYEMSEDGETLNGLAVQGDISIKVIIDSGRGLAGLVAKERRVINLQDAYEHPNFDVRVDRHTGYRTRSVLCVPMFGASGDVIGVVQVLNKLTGAFSLEDQNLLGALAAQAAITLEALRLEFAIAERNKSLSHAKAQLSRKLEEQELLFEIEKSISNADSLHELAESVLTRAAQVVRSDYVGLFVVNAEDQGPAYIKSAGSDHITLSKTVTLGEGIMGKVAARVTDFILMKESFELEAIEPVLWADCDIKVDNALAASLYDGTLALGSLVFVNCDVLYQSTSKEQARLAEDEAPDQSLGSDKLGHKLPIPERSEDRILGSQFTPYSEYKYGGDWTAETRKSWLGKLSERDESGHRFNSDPTQTAAEIEAEIYYDRSRALSFVSLIARQLGRGISATLARHKEEQRSRLSSIGQMLSGVLHDIKGPMTSIRGYTQLISRSDDPEQRARLAETILKKINTFNEMTSDLIAFARGDRRVLRRKVFLQQFVESVREAVQFEFDEHEVAFEVEGDAGAVAYFDEGKMRRVVINIARNARQALGRSGTFCWHINQNSAELVFTLSDDGPGIPASIRDRVFELFESMGKEEGTGLGLAIVRQIVLDHDGRIELETATDRGTTFTITIPQQRDPEGSS